MKNRPRIGLTGELAFKIEPQHAIDFCRRRNARGAVHPYLIGFLERTARDERELIARGLHKRAVIRVDRFAQRVQEKST
jgi:predicted thioesterase